MTAVEFFNVELSGRGRCRPCGVAYVWIPGRWKIGDHACARCRTALRPTTRAWAGPVAWLYPIERGAKAKAFLERNEPAISPRIKKRKPGQAPASPNSTEGE